MVQQEHMCSCDQLYGAARICTLQYRLSAQAVETRVEVSVGLNCWSTIYKHTITKALGRSCFCTVLHAAPHIRP